MPIRLDRYGSVLRKEISDILFKKMQDQGLGLVSVTHIKISKDVSQASVYFSVLGGDQEKAKVYRKLNDAAKFIKGEISRVIRNVTIPDLIFVYDDSLDRGVRMSQRIDEIIREDSSNR
ncbi:30S ribosome-binding factor RbfA [bacterium]|nr:30S ribosome-binding factor RbfA [bacterium]